MRKFDVIMECGSSAPGTSFEGKNRLNKGANVSYSLIGLGTYISGSSKLRNVHVGRFCSIGRNVETGFGIHPTSFLSTHPAFYSTRKQAGFTFVDTDLFEEHKYVDFENRYYVSIGNDVWIGNDVKILDGVKVGDGAIIALGSVVTKDVLPYSIVGGVPAKTIRMRFDDLTVLKLLDMKWWNLDQLELIEKANSFSQLKENQNGSRSS